MMDNTQLERIEMPAPQDFWQRYIRGLTPVVITNLFEGDAIRRIGSREQVLAAWPSVEVPVDDEYDDAIGISQVRRQLQARQALGAERRWFVPQRTHLSLAHYYDLVTASGGRAKPRVAFEAPAEILRCLRIPDVCFATSNESQSRSSCCFIGTRGSFSQLHFDKDGTHGLLFQVYGRKRFIVVPPSATAKLGPFTQFSSWNVQSFTEEDRLAFLRYTGGMETVLEPGEAVYLPAFCWHFADYLDDCFALNIRFRRSNAVTAFLNLVPFPDISTQQVGTHFADALRPESEWRPLLEDLQRIAGTSNPDGLQKMRELRAASRALHARLYPEAARGTYHLDLEGVFPPPLPHFLDANAPTLPRYR